MNLTRKTFLKWLAAAAGWPWLGMDRIQARPRMTGKARMPEDARLRAWMHQPRIPVWEAGPGIASWLIDAALRGATVEFNYDGGSEPGEARTIAVGLVFHHPDSSVLYASGYCHRRREERVFRLDRIRPAVMGDTKRLEP